MIKGLDYWYDGQMRRFLEQIVRAFSGFQYQTGVDASGQPQLKMVPCRMALTEKMVANIIKNGSENTLLAVPMICVYQTALAGRREAVQNLNHVDTRQVVERAIDPVTGKYTDQKGNAYTVERLMPRPFMMSVNVDIWTSNMDQKHQLAEQLLTVFFPDISIQNSENPLDWTALTTMNISDIIWSSRSIPVGTDSDLDLMTIALELPFWLSPPAKVKHQTIIQQVVANIHDATIADDVVDDNVLTTNITTPGEHAIQVENGVLTLLGPRGAVHTPDGDIYPWKDLVEQYGTLRPTLSTIRLKTNPDLDDWSHDLVGTIQYDSANPNQIFWQLDPDTLPGNTLPPVTGIIDPRKAFPGEGLPAAAAGQRYLIIHSLSGPSQAWGPLNAGENDIIEYVNGAWTVSYTPHQGNKTPQYVLNLHTGTQLRWNGWDWVLTIDGIYEPGYWRIQL